MSHQPEEARTAIVKRHFTEHAKLWEDIYSTQDVTSLNIQLRQANVLAFVETLELEAGAKVLDLGCGAGMASAILLEQGFEVVGVDVSEAMLELARKNCGRVSSTAKATFLMGSAEDLEFANEEFDLVIALGLIEYLKWDRWALQQMHRVLKPGGHLIVTVPNELRLAHLVDPVQLLRICKRRLRAVAKRMALALLGPDRLQGLRARQDPKGPTGNPGPATLPRNLYVLSKLRGMLEKLDFDVLDTRSHGFGAFRGLQRSTRLSLKLHGLLQRLSETRLCGCLAGLGNNHNVLCRKQTLPAELRDRPILKNITTTVKTVDSQIRGRIRRRDQWLAENPEYARMELCPVKPEETFGGHVLVLSPHPDDEVIGCGGTLIRAVEHGAQVTVVHLTDGSSSAGLRDLPEETARTVRLDEAKRVAEFLNFNEPIFFREKDGELECSSANVERLTAILEDIRPSVIFTPFTHDPHPDHVVCNHLLARALQASSLEPASVMVFAYEVWSCVPPNRYSGIDDYCDRKALALLKYSAGMKVVDYVHFCESLGAYHAKTLLDKVGFVEAFFATDGEAYLSIAHGTKVPDASVEPA